MLNKIIFVISIFLFQTFPTALAQNQFCSNVNGRIVCGPERFQYFFGDNSGRWCITLAQPLGTPDFIRCIYNTKSQCIDDNPMRQFANSRCVKNPKFSENDE